MRVLIDEAYKVHGAKYIAISKSGNCYWAQAGIAFMNIDKSELVTMIEYLVDNIFVQVGNKIFRQGIGIPMGTDCVPEYRYMRGLIKNNFYMARRFTNTVRYIDDLLTLNKPSFETEIANIYSPELVLKKTTESTTVVS